MKKSLKVWSALIFFLFIFPIILEQIPSEIPDDVAVVAPLTNQQLVYATNLLEQEPQIQTGMRALLFSTHSHEAYEPITQQYDGEIAVTHPQANIMKLNETIKAQLEFNGIVTEVLEIDTAAVMSEKSIPYNKAYNVVRSYLQKSMKEVDYDIIIDIHRDSLKAERTTLTYDGEKYAQIVFVIGGEHANYKFNRELAERLTVELEQIVPGITRPLVFKAGHGVDGKYNQDLDQRLILIEMGGIGNNEEELNRTSSVLAKAVSKVLQ
ncbi:stage II sporulation protein P [Sporosarcina sp. ANT_H38]|uniref:stage II sporulation protein P n=1 Tax=Sporosarcina sp. ANT_H38 TaxID=2597358 RepID=UPI0011F1F392|nr:stage II sporulation protein P [Sporosarcina sp. ANT_H38]KAA0965312.1 stage II sporulation protein P [Sporosarcina sp. ANT_H38]